MWCVVVGSVGHKLSRRDANIVITGNTGDCRHDNLRCHQWRQSDETKICLQDRRLQVNIKRPKCRKSKTHHTETLTKQIPGHSDTNLCHVYFDLPCRIRPNPEITVRLHSGFPVHRNHIMWLSQSWCHHLQHGFINLIWHCFIHYFRWYYHGDTISQDAIRHCRQRLMIALFNSFL